MGICGSKQVDKQPKQQQQQQNEDDDDKQQSGIAGFFRFVQMKFNPTPPPTKPKLASNQTGTFGDNIVQTQQSKRVASIYEKTKASLTGKFSDGEFSATVQSLTTDPNRFKIANTIVWLSPKEFLGADEKIFVFDKIEPNDIKQGGLGDCYFLSSLSALAEYPGIIQKMFVTSEYQENGLYCVWLCHDGEFIQVLLDDKIPCRKDQGPVFSRSNGAELWVLLLEKAYAKIYGTYEKIESGISGNALRDLTGAPYEYLNKSTEKQNGIQEQWDFINTNITKKYILTASSETDPRGVEFQQDSGIVSQHCYAILDARTVTEANHTQTQIVQLRNPWGHKEWKGDWSDKSSKWTPELRQQLNVQIADDGIFWIAMPDFVKEFSQVRIFNDNQICASKLHADYKYCAIHLEEDPKTQQLTTRVVKLHVLQDSHIFLNLTQKDKRNYAKTDIQYNYSMVGMVVGRIDYNNYEINSFVGQALEVDRDVGIEAHLQAGEYVVFLEVDWAQKINRHLVLNSYGSNEVVFNEMKFTDDDKIKVLDGVIRKHQDVANSGNPKKKDYGNGITKVSGNIGGYVYFLYSNTSKNSTLVENVTMTNLSNLKICPPYTNDSSYGVNLGPSLEILVKFKISPEGNGSYGYGCKISQNITQEFTRDELKKMAKESPKKVDQRMDGQQVGVAVYTYSYPNGTVLLYENQGSKTFTETLTLKLTNLGIDGDDISNPMNIQLAPGQDKLISLKIIDATQGTGYGLRMTYSFK